MEPIAHQPIATLVASSFQLTGQPDAKGHGQFDLESCPVQYPWLNPFLVLNMNLQNVRDLESRPVQYPWLNPFLVLNMNLQNLN